MFDLGRSILQSVERRPEALALVDGDLRLTYAEWYREIVRVAGGLAAMGLARGDRLVSVLQNRAEAATVHWACQILGLVITPINWRSKAGEIDYCLHNAEAAGIVFEGISEIAVAESPAARALPRIAVGGAEGGTARFDELAGRAVSPVADAEDLSLMLYTSGTTGQPKGVPRRHRQERAAALAHVAQSLYATGERTLGVMPLYHTMGVRSLLSMALVDGAFVCLPRFSSEGALALIEREGLTCLYLVPTLYHELVSHPQFAATKTGSVRKLGFAGAAMTDGLLKKVDAAFRPELFVNHYGSSEIYTFTIDQQARRKPGSAGRAGLNQRIRVVRLGSHDPELIAAVGEEGEIVADLASEEAFEGYWRRPEADARAIHGGWYYTGDIGYRDGDGDLFVTGRVDDMIITGGENVSPGEIESVLSLHPAVAEVAVVGLPDQRWGQRIVGFVKRSSPVTAAALDDWCCRSNLANFKRPRQFVFVREVPKSPVGKLLRRKLVAGEFDPEAANNTPVSEGNQT
jgi:2-furoate---CoA ligase